MRRSYTFGWSVNMWEIELELASVSTLGVHQLFAIIVKRCTDRDGWLMIDWWEKIGVDFVCLPLGGVPRPPLSREGEKRKRERDGLSSFVFLPFSAKDRRCDTHINFKYSDVFIHCMQAVKKSGRSLLWCIISYLVVRATLLDSTPTINRSAEVDKGSFTRRIQHGIRTIDFGRYRRVWRHRPCCVDEALSGKLVGIYIWRRI